MLANQFFEYVKLFGEVEPRSMFGDIGYFYQNAMFALQADERLYLRGGGRLDDRLRALQCAQYTLVKKHSCAQVNYYDITDLYNEKHVELDTLVELAKTLSIREKQQKQNPSHKRLRDLPNLHLTLERMLKKSGIDTVEDFYSCGAVEAYIAVKEVYGNQVSESILWKFYCAIEGMHWELLQEPKKRALKQQVQMFELGMMEKVS